LYGGFVLIALFKGLYVQSTIVSYHQWFDVMQYAN
jgi:hypothetical protein